MFQYPDADANAASNQPPGGNYADGAKGAPRQERLRHVLYGSLAAIDRTIKILHSRGYADPNDWCDPIPTDKPNQWMVIMTKIMLLE